MTVSSASYWTGLQYIHSQSFLSPFWLLPDKVVFLMNLCSKFWIPATTERKEVRSHLILLYTNLIKASPALLVRELMTQFSSWISSNSAQIQTQQSCWGQEKGSPGVFRRYSVPPSWQASAADSMSQHITTISGKCVQEGESDRSVFLLVE